MIALQGNSAVFIQGENNCCSAAEEALGFEKQSVVQGRENGGDGGVQWVPKHSGRRSRIGQ